MHAMLVQRLERVSVRATSVLLLYESKSHGCTCDGETGKQGGIAR